MWRVRCGECAVENTMEGALWSVRCGGCAVENIMEGAQWRLRCGGCAVEAALCGMHGVWTDVFSQLRYAVHLLGTYLACSS